MSSICDRTQPSSTMNNSRRYSILFFKMSICSLFVGLILFCLNIDNVQAEMCRKLKPTSDPELFQCPRIFEPNKKSWCCGSNTLDSYCCEWADRAKEAGLTMSILQDSFKYVILTIVSLVFFIGFLWAVCYIASKQNLFQHQRHRNDHDSPSGYPHHPGAPPLTPPFPPVPPYSSYPSATCPTQNCSDLPPSYTQLYGHGDTANAANAPVTVPLLSSEQKEQTDLKEEATTPEQSTTPTVATVIIKSNSAAALQPPFNPSYT